MSLWKKILIGLAGLLVVIQVVPYGRDHSNPPVAAEPAWDSPRTRELAAAACFDCHSNETDWRWYTSIAPASWLTQRDVDEGRRILNFSEWDRTYRATREAAETLERKSMPPIYYGWLHSNARFTQAEIDELAAGLRASLGSG